MNNTLQHVSEGLDKIFIDMTVKCMLNPNNKDFYIGTLGTLTLDKVKQMFVEMNEPDDGLITIFWKAYAIAEAIYLKRRAKHRLHYLHINNITGHVHRFRTNEELDEFAKRINVPYTVIDTYTHCTYAYDNINGDARNHCPECGCGDYVEGVACPNCDYVEEV